MPNLDFDPSKEIPDLKGKVILITGGTNGLGFETALSFAAHGPAHIYFTGRSQPSADKLIKEVKTKYSDTPITFIRCDLASLQFVEDAAKELVSKTDRLDIFMANAGIMALPPGLTNDGYEIQFGTNHMGHALLSKLLTPLMEATANQHGNVRIVWNTSLGYKAHPKGGILFDKLKTPQKDIAPAMGEWMRYGQSKLANLLYSRSFSKHHPPINSICIHPGVSATGLVNNLSFMKRALVYVTNIGNMLTPEQCAYNQEWASTAPLGKGDKQVESGVYYEPVGIKGKLTGEGSNDELAEKLWDWTHRELEAYSL